MAEWIKLPDNSYVRLSSIHHVYAGPVGDGTFAIFAGVGPGEILRGGFATQAAAQSALDSAIVNNGGSL